MRAIKYDVACGVQPAELARKSFASGHTIKFAVQCQVIR